MTTSKIDIKVGIVEFSGEGEPKWLSEQLDKILEKIPELLKIELGGNVSSNTKANNSSPESNFGGDRDITLPTLPKFLKEKNATTVQNRKFLATAIWIQLKENKKSLTTSDVNRAIKDSQQSKLGNSSENLNQNVSKGYCEKESNNNFFVTQEGLDEILGTTGS